MKSKVVNIKDGYFSTYDGDYIQCVDVVLENNVVKFEFNPVTGLAHIELKDKDGEVLLNRDYQKEVIA